MTPAPQRRAAFAAEDLQARLQRFLESCREPVVVEPGEAPVALEPGKFSLETRGSSCVLHAWGEQVNIVRRLSAIRKEGAHSIDLSARGFGGRQQELTILDRARARSGFERNVEQSQFQKFLGRIIEREFSGWKLKRLTAAADLANSLSPRYARGVLQRGQRCWAVIGVSKDLGSKVCDAILATGLIWLDQVRRQQRRRACAGLRIFVPAGRGSVTANRLAWLNRSALGFELFEFDARGELVRIDEQDFGNVSTSLAPCLPAGDLREPARGWTSQLLANLDVQAVPRSDGFVSLRVRGIEVARAAGSKMTYGLDSDRPVSQRTMPHLLELTRELARLRSPDADDETNPMYRQYPERWLESEVWRNLRAIDVEFDRSPIYSSVPAVAGADRGLIDLLACDSSGRLAVIELKAGEDMCLPLQGLDYWLRVKWHLDRGDFSLQGYFPQRPLSLEAPRLILAAPALEFHSMTETMLRYFSPQIEVERVGLNSSWRHGLKVEFRRRGAGRLA